MTFVRALIVAGMAAGFQHYAGDGSSLLSLAMMGFAGWQFTTDPLPDAVERALDAYRRKHQR